jgi:ABC-type uncharacterized transport system substrate-binding protein
MKSILSGLLILAVLAIVVVDGMAVYVAFTSAREVASGAGEQAAIEYVTSHGNLNTAKQAAQSFADSKNTVLVSIDYHQAEASYFTVSTQKMATTYVLKYIPGMKKLLLQKSTAVTQIPR